MASGMCQELNRAINLLTWTGTSSILNPDGPVNLSKSYASSTQNASVAKSIFHDGKTERRHSFPSIRSRAAYLLLLFPHRGWL